jgi:hypothetical protein
MAELAALLGTVSILLTFVAVYRIAGFVSTGSPVFALVTAFAVTLSYMILFEFVLFAFGLMALFAPVAVVYYRRGSVPVASPLLRRVHTKIRRLAGWDTNICGECDTVNEASDEYCKNCGRKLVGDES